MPGLGWPGAGNPTLAHNRLERTVVTMSPHSTSRDSATRGPTEKALTITRQLIADQFDIPGV